MVNNLIFFYFFIKFLFLFIKFYYIQENVLNKSVFSLGLLGKVDVTGFSVFLLLS